jgi:hypothetical protein
MMPMMMTMVAAVLIWKMNLGTPVENRVEVQETAMVIKNNIYQRKEKEL